MKVLSLPQPWAAFACLGIIDVICKPWHPDEVPGKILIHADSTKTNVDYIDTLPYQLQGIVYNHYFMENFPNFDYMPTNAIIGCVTVTGFKQKTDSVWDRDPDLIKWEIEDPWLLEDVIENVYIQREYFDYNIEESDFPPCFKHELKEIHFEDGKLVLPTRNSFIARFIDKETDDLFYYFDSSQTDLLLEDEEPFDPIPAETVILESHRRRVEFKLKRPPYISFFHDDNYQPVDLKWDDGHTSHWFCIAFRIGEKLNEVKYLLPDELYFSPDLSENN